MAAFLHVSHYSRTAFSFHPPSSTSYQTCLSVFFAVGNVSHPRKNAQKIGKLDGDAFSHLHFPPLKIQGSRRLFCNILLVEKGHRENSACRLNGK